MADNNTARRLSSIVNIDLLDPILEAMLEGVLLPGSNANVSVEFNFIPFVVDESEMDHQWHPGPMDVDYLDEDGEDKDEEDEGEILYGDNEEEDYGEGGDEGIEEGEEVNGEEEEEEGHDRYDYSSQRDYDEAEEEVEEGEEDEDEERNEEDGYDEGDEEVEEEDEDDEDDVRFEYIDNSVLANYGSLGWAICHNISDRKILHDTFNSRDFLRQMVEFFFTHLKQPTLSSSASLHLLLNCLPSLVDLKNLISKKKYTMKEALVIKVVLEMYESYYKTFGAPNFKVYHTEVIPLLLDFYNKLPDSVLKLMSKQLTRALLNLNGLTTHFKLYQTQQEFIEHYRESTRRMRNLSECTDPKLFIR